MFDGNAPNFLGPVGIDTGGGGGGFNPIAETTIDITGLTQIDLSGKTNYGIINLTSTNPSETIIKIINCTDNQRRVFRPNGFSIEWDDISVNPLGNLKLAGPTITIDGAHNGYIALQLRTAPAYFFSLDYTDLYTP